MSPIDQPSSTSFLAHIGAAFAHGDSRHQAKPVESANVETVRAAIGLLLAGDVPGFAECLTEDVVLEIVGFPAWNGRWKGREDVLASMARNFGELVEQTPTVEALVAQGNQLVLLLAEHGQFRSGERYRMRASQWFTLREGKIAAVREIVAPID